MKTCNTCKHMLKQENGAICKEYGWSLVSGQETIISCDKTVDQIQMSDKEVSCENCEFSSQFCNDVLICGKFEWEIKEPVESAINCTHYTPKTIKFRVGKPQKQEFEV